MIHILPGAAQIVVRVFHGLVVASYPKLANVTHMRQLDNNY